MSETSPLQLDLDRLLRAVPAESGLTQPEQPNHEPPALQPAPRPAKRRSNPLSGALAAVSVILTILIAQLGLSIVVSEGAYELRALEVEQRDLERVERLLTQNLDKLASPQNLSDNAVRLGMVQNATPATIRLSDGAVLGALESKTSAAGENLVPNATLESMPVVDADGLLVSRSTEVPASVEPVRWEGKLPAPETR